jgi:hypothetical protein
VRLLGVGGGSNDAFASVEGQSGQLNLIFRNVEPGRYSVRIDPNWPWYVSSAEYGQTNLLTDDLLIAAGAPAQSLQITVRNDGAQLTCSLNVSENMTHPATVIAISQGTPKASPRIMTVTSSRARPGNPTDFGLDRLAPGEYLVFAFDHIDDVEYSNPEVLQNYISRAAHITLSANQHARISLELIRTGEDAN